jgi:hypothetical protein
MPDPVAVGNVPLESPQSDIAVFDQRLARVSALATLATIFAAVAYSRESGFAVYAVLFAIPYAVFGLVRGSRKWQAWGWALAWLITTVTLVATASTSIRILRHVHHSEIAALVFLMVLLLTQAAQLIFVRRAFPGTIAFGAPLFRNALYYVCLLLVVAATLPNWYVPPIVRSENKAMNSLREYSTAMESYAKVSKNASYPPQLSALAVPVDAGKTPSSTLLDSELVCEQASCTNNGYRFTYRPFFKKERVASYTISARPLEFEETGNHSFLLSSDGKIHETREDRDALLTDTKDWD